MNKLILLIVDDNPADIRLIEESLRGISHKTYTASTGEEGLEKLKEIVDKGDTPNVVLLDINMPVMDGKEFLKKLKEDKKLSIIPVIVLTTSDNQSDVNDCYDLLANAYVVKPIGLEEFDRAINNIGLFWKDIAKSPEIEP